MNKNIITRTKTEIAINSGVKAIVYENYAVLSSGKVVLGTTTKNGAEVTYVAKFTSAVSVCRFTLPVIDFDNVEVIVDGYAIRLDAAEAEKVLYELSSTQAGPFLNNGCSDGGELGYVFNMNNGSVVAATRKANNLNWKSKVAAAAYEYYMNFYNYQNNVSETEFLNNLSSLMKTYRESK